MNRKACLSIAAAFGSRGSTAADAPAQSANTYVALTLCDAHATVPMPIVSA